MARSISSTFGSLLDVVGTSADMVSKTVNMASGLIDAGAYKVTAIREDVKNNTLADMALSQDKAQFRLESALVGLHQDRARLEAQDAAAYAWAKSYAAELFAEPAKEE